MAFAVLAIVAGGISWLVFCSRDAEPVYQGKTLSQWLENYAVGRPPIVSGPHGPRIATRESDEAIRAMGTNAIPHLLRILRQHDSNIKLKLVELARRQNVVKIVFVPASTRKPWVTTAFAALGAQGQPAVPGLIEIYERGPDTLSRSSSANALARIGPAAQQAVPALIHGATNIKEDPETRSESIFALGQIGGDAMVVPVLIQLLKEPSGDGPMGAVSILFSVDIEAAKPAVPALFEFLKTLNSGPNKFRDYDVHGIHHGVHNMNSIICRLIQQIDPETAAVRKSEIDAVLNANSGQ